MPNSVKPTIFSVMSLSNILLSSGLAIMLFLVVVRPEASSGLNVIERLVFWTLHVGAGILAMFIASQLMKKFNNSVVNALPSILVCGVLGTLLVAPFYVAVDYIWPTPGSHDIDGMLDQLAASGLPGTVIAETLEILPWTLSAWLIINLPILSNSIGARSDPAAAWDNPVTRRETPVPPESGTRNNAGVASGKEVLPEEIKTENTPNETASPQVLQSLPGVFGKDIIAVTSDLHYLNVYTLIGKTTILGNLRDVVSELDQLGMQVHRSHWVAHDHVTRTVNTGGQAACILSNGMRVPVSRRRWKDVREYYGQGVIQRS